MEENEVQAVEEAPMETQETPSKSARELYYERIKANFPDKQFGDDDEIYGAALEYTDGIEGKLNKIQSGNDELAEKMMKDPKVAAAFMDFISGKPLPAALNRYFSEDEMKMKEGDEGWEDYLEAEKQRLADYEASKTAKAEYEANLEASQKDIDAFISDKGMKEEDFDVFMGKVTDAVTQKLLKGMIDKEFLEIFYKGLNYDTDMNTAEQAGMVKGKNEKIVTQTKLPDMPELKTTGGGAPAEAPKVVNKTAEFYDKINAKRASGDIWERGKK